MVNVYGGEVCGWVLFFVACEARVARVQDACVRPRVKRCTACNIFTAVLYICPRLEITKAEAGRVTDVDTVTQEQCHVY